MNSQSEMNLRKMKIHNHVPINFKALKKNRESLLQRPSNDHLKVSKTKEKNKYSSTRRKLLNKNKAKMGSRVKIKPLRNSLSTNCFMTFAEKKENVFEKLGKEIAKDRESTASSTSNNDPSSNLNLNRIKTSHK